MLQERIKQVFHQRKAIAVGSFVFSFALSLSFVLGIQLKYIGYTWGGKRQNCYHSRKRDFICNN